MRSSFHPVSGSATVLTSLFIGCMVLFSSLSFSQQTSRGRDFYFSYLPNYHNDGTNSADSLYIYVVADSATTGTLTYKNRAGQTFTQTINITNPAQIWQHQVQWSSFELLGYNQSGTFVTDNDNETAANQVFHVVTNKDVAVYALNKAVTTSDATMVLPTSLLGTEYYVLAYKADGALSGGNNLNQSYTPSEFVVIATDDNTTVTVNPSAPTTETGSATKTFTLQRGQAYLFQSQFSTSQLRYDLSGSRVTANKPLAIFAGHQRATVPVEFRGSLTSRDQLYEQMLPTNVWGKSYIITPLAQPQGISTVGWDLWRVVASEDGTTLNFNGSQVSTLNRGQVYEASLTTAGLLTASKKVMVALYKKSHSDNPSTLLPGDPFMMIIPPRRQYLNKYRFSNIQALGSFSQQFITVVTTRNNINSIQFDGAALNATFTDIPNTCFAYSNVRVGSNAHTLQSQQPVGLYVYGYGDADSYGYVGGMALVADVAEVDIDAGPDRTICLGDTVHLRVTGAASNIKWTPKTGLNNDTGRVVIATPQTTTTYIVSAIDSLGCDSKDTVVVNVRRFIVDAGRDTTMCPNGDSVSLKVRGVNGTPNKVLWTPKTGLKCDTCLETKAHPPTTTRYIVTAQDSMGCYGRDTVTITILPPIAVDAGPDQEFCSAADSVILRVTAPGTKIKSVKWTPSVGLGCDTCITTKARPPGTTTYIVTVVDSAGCDGLDSVHVLLKSRSNGVKLSDPQSICSSGDSAVLAITGKVMKVVWTPKTGLSCDTCPRTIAKPAVTTTYTCDVIDALGCTFKDSIKITVLPKAIVNVDPDTIACTSTGILLRADGVYQNVEWTPPIGIVCATCNQTMAVPPKRTITYYAIAHNGNSKDCDAIDSVTVKYAPGIEGQIPPIIDICLGDSVPLKLNFGGKVTWTPKTYLPNDTTKNAVIKPLKNIRYTITGDSAGCTSRVTVDIRVFQGAGITAPNDTAICRGDSLVLMANRSDTSSAAVQWTPTVGLNCPTCIKPTAKPTMTTKYYVTIGTGKCATTDSVTITIKDRPLGRVTPADTSLCEGGSVQYNVAVDPIGSSIRWSPATALSCSDCPNPVATPGSTISYTINILAPNGCDTNLTARIGVGRKPVFSILNRDTAFCRGGQVRIRFSGDTTGSFTWQPTVGLSCPTCASTTAKPDVTTTYIVRGKDVGSGCESFDTVRVVVNQLPVFDTITPNTRICKNNQVRLYAATGTRYEWSPNDGSLDRTDIQSPTAKPQQTTTYTVRMYNAQNCFSDSSVTITVEPCGDDIQLNSNTLSALIACDSSQTTISATATGQVPVQIDSVGVIRTNNGSADLAFLAQQNAARFPLTLQPGTTLTPPFPVRVYPNSTGNYSVTFRFYTPNTARLDTVTIFGRGDDREVKFFTKSNSIAADSSFEYPVFGESRYWSELKITEVLTFIRYTSSSMSYDSSKALILGDMLDATWNVKHLRDSVVGNDNISIFNAKGTTPLMRDGVLFTPHFRSLLSNEFVFTPTISYLLPSLRIDCADTKVENAPIEIINCARNIRRVSISGTQFALISVTPNPAGTSQEVKVEYGIGFPCIADVRLYDEIGREVSALAYGKHQDGVYTLTFDATSLASGTYYCTLSAAGNYFSKQIHISR